MCKKIVSVILALTLIMSMCSLAEGGLYYDALLTYYEAYLAYEQANDPKGLEELRNLVSYYIDDEDRKKDLDRFEVARQYLNYAQGRLAIDEGNYLEAQRKFARCGAFGHKTDVYYSFAVAILDCEDGNYKESLPKLKALSNSEIMYAIRLYDAIDKYEPLYKSSFMEKARKAELKGDVEAAKGYYTELLEYDMFKYDPEIKAALAALGVVPSSVNLTIDNCQAVDQNRINVKWSGDGSEYTVKWTMDLSGKTGTESAKTSALEYMITGLEPNTEYFVTVECSGVKESAKAKTKIAKSYSESDTSFIWANSSTLYAIEDLDELRLHVETNNRMRSTFVDLKNIRRSRTRIVSLDSAFTQVGAEMFVFQLKNAPEKQLDGKPYTLLLRVNGGTACKKGTFGDFEVALEKTNIYVLLSDMLAETSENYNGLSGSKFTLELLIDGMFAASATGTFE
ncbi:MAG: fibronectin type III domain-containing protein [Clostridiales bacterium]|nr:fibronectin type III domain-containing protein [Clostridiales bacterium]